MTDHSSKRAEELNQQGMDHSDAGHDDLALQSYLRALELDPLRADTLYNVGLIHKYRRAWNESFEFNARSRAVVPDKEATLWNLAIAATALRDWQTARDVWQSLGIAVGSGEGPINGNFGSTPVRLNADEDDGKSIEVVWTRRLCPVRARILNIPTASTGFRYGDVVLHDGAETGTRLDADGNEKSVFNVLELFETSDFSTYEGQLFMRSPADLDALERLCDEAGIPVEDWTASIKMLCKACSEGRAHEQHDHDLPANSEWQTDRRVGFAVIHESRLTAIIGQWSARPGCRVKSLERALEGRPALH